MMMDTDAGRVASQLGSRPTDQAPSGLRPSGDDPLREMLAAIHRETQAAFNQAAGTEDWEYRDLPRLSEPMYSELIERIGEENVRVMAGSSGAVRMCPDTNRFVDCEPWVRASLLISPDGIQRLRDSATHPKGGDASGSGSAE